MMTLSQLTITLLLAGSSALTQGLTWVAVVDQINEPWVSLISEDGRLQEVHRAQCFTGLREGMWVKYHAREGKVTRLKAPSELAHAFQVERELSEQLRRLTHDAEP